MKKLNIFIMILGLIIIMSTVITANEYEVGLSYMTFLSEDDLPDCFGIKFSVINQIYENVSLEVRTQSVKSRTDVIYKVNNLSALLLYNLDQYFYIKGGSGYYFGEIEDKNNQKEYKLEPTFGIIAGGGAETNLTPKIKFYAETLFRYLTYESDFFNEQKNFSGIELNLGFSYTF